MFQYAIEFNPEYNSGIFSHIETLMQDRKKFATGLCVPFVNISLRASFYSTSHFSTHIRAREFAWPLKTPNLYRLRVNKLRVINEIFQIMIFHLKKNVLHLGAVLVTSPMPVAVPIPIVFLFIPLTTLEGAATEKRTIKKNSFAVKMAMLK